MRIIADIHKKLGSFSLDSSFDTTDLISGILGSSGSGKSMSLKCIAGIETPDSGYIEVNGRVLFDSRKKINVRPQERGVGYLFQNYALFPTMSVKKNILCPMRWIKDKEIKKSRYDEVVSLLHLEGLDDHMPWQLSGGQAQRTALARMLLSDPEILLLDEPFSALDAFLRKKLQTELISLLDIIGKQTLLVTHSPKEVKRMCSYLFVMNNGKVIREGLADDVFSSPGSPECEILLDI